MILHGDDDTLHRDLHPLGGGRDDPQVRLMRHDPVHVGAGQPGLVKRGMRRRGQTIVLVSHRVQAITMADLLLYIDRGIQRAFGTRDEVMRLFQGATAGTGAPKPEPAAPATTPPQNGAGA